MNGIFKEGAKQTPDHQGPAGIVISPNGSPSLPGELFLFCQGDREGQTCGGFGVISLTIPGGGSGLHYTLSPIGLRHFAGQCVSMAASLEATAAREADEVIARARGAGK